MKPEIFHLPWVGWPIHGYGLMIIIGFLLATWLASREARRRGLPPVICDLGLVMLLAGIIGGRVFYYAQFYEEQFAVEPWYKFFYIWKGGLVFYGGAIGGALGGYLYIKLWKLPMADLLDAVSPFIPIAMGFGRLGCFLNGCCYGHRCAPDFPLAIQFPRGSPDQYTGAFLQHLDKNWIAEDSAYSLPVYPTQLFEAGQDFLLFPLLWWYARGPSPRGGGMPLLFLLYGVGRFGMEILRGDSSQNAKFLGWTIPYLTISQLVSLLTVAVFGAIFARLWARELSRGRRFAAAPS